jgi:hypothetical protein
MSSRILTAIVAATLALPVVVLAADAASTTAAKPLTRASRSRPAPP